MTQQHQSFTIDWQGITLSVTYDPAAFGGVTSHLQVQSIAPERARLPITETGYRSHFLPPGCVEQAGGPHAYVSAWLEQASNSLEWQKYLEQSRQGSLF